MDRGPQSVRMIQMVITEAAAGRYGGHLSIVPIKGRVPCLLVSVRQILEYCATDAYHCVDADWAVWGEQDLVRTLAAAGVMHVQRPFRLRLGALDVPAVVGLSIDGLQRYGVAIGTIPAHPAIGTSVPGATLG